MVGSDKSSRIFAIASRFLKWEPTELNATVVKRCGSKGSKGFNFYFTPCLPLRFSWCDYVKPLNLNRMETQYVTFNGHEFPSYLGFGVLDEKSFTTEGEKTFALYHLEHSGEKVYWVRLEIGLCELTTFFEREQYRNTLFFGSLKDALLYEYAFVNQFYQNKVFLQLTGILQNISNILFNPMKPGYKDWKLNFYPAGKLFTFKLPLDSQDPKAKEILESLENAECIGSTSFHDGYVLYYDPDKGIIKEKQKVAEFIVPMAYIVKVALMISGAGLLLPKPRQMFVEESAQAESTISDSEFNSTSAWMITFRDISGSGLPLPETVFKKALKVYRTDILNPESLPVTG